jgi:hypothetical protein
VYASNRSGGTNRSFGPITRLRLRIDRVDMDACPRLLRLLVCVTGIAATVALATACGGGSGGTANAAADPPQLVTYRGGGLSFRHPESWTAYPFRWSGELHFRPLVYLSTQPVHDPCSTHRNTTSCGFPVRRIRPGGVLVVWQVNGVPAVGLGPGARIQVGGHAAARVATQGGICRRIGADRTIEVAVETIPTPSALTYLTACLRGPNLAQSERRVDALLASTRFTSQ